ncbi:DUF2334 domain-containing protein [Saccharospirillum mangrovi]|uniref:DUF2334 domain-containing protein n=1 Tax=Saccharospirillum mangrovi TaxID=2161747 RepID=UPI000D35238F|nr:polysaccharide deacetylase family protein [Saccharospirillum mangrovi]
MSFLTRSGKTKPAIVSLHDVMPDTLDDVRWWLTHWLADVPPADLTLLVVPGLDWQPAQLEQLRAWQQQGYELAGHGWQHRVRRISTLYHRLHSTFVSRQAAEHLSLSEAELIELIERNYQWFTDNDFQSPELYVPPAWALGQLGTTARRHLPFRYLESTAGFHDLHAGRFHALPLAGFEADARWRVPSLRLWNGLNRRVATAQRALRLSIHPHDHRYYLADDLQRWLQSGIQPINYRQVLHRTKAPQAA